MRRLRIEHRVKRQKVPDVLPPLIEHLPSQRFPGKTACGLNVSDVSGRQAVTDMPLPDRICLTCESIHRVKGAMA